MWNCSGWHKTVSKGNGAMQGCPLQLLSLVFFGLEWMTSSKEKNVRRMHLAGSSARARQQSKGQTFATMLEYLFHYHEVQSPTNFVTSLFFFDMFHAHNVTHHTQYSVQGMALLHGKYAHCVFITWCLGFLRLTTLLSTCTTTSLHLMTTALTFQSSHWICTRRSANSCRRQVHSHGQRAYVTP